VTRAKRNADGPSGGGRPGAPASSSRRASASRSRPPALKRFGQNHLVDVGTREAILAMARVGRDDVVLEVGAADGSFTVRLLEQARLVHAFEVDRRFADRLAGLATTHDNLHVCLADALRADLEGLEPAPNALVANLAYNIAIPLIMKTIASLPSVDRWAVMVQKELADRLFAVPRTKAYSAVSVLVQLACAQEARRPVPRTVFAPPPNVDSAFVVFTRRADWPEARWAALEALVRTAFGQRRKLLLNSLSGAARGGRAVTRDQIGRALETLELSPQTRPEELTPPEFVRLADALEWV
jgi:16S rRNA (adenine1518-N6/adenine1519-N6)-dimethyltransferase